jgi:PAS domain S-box-containing protein
LCRPMNSCWNWRKGELIESALQPEANPENQLLQQRLRQLKRALRDLVALSVMPAAWVGRGPREVANGLLELLFSTLRLDAAYVCIDSVAGEEACEITECTQLSEFQTWIEKNKESLRPRRKVEGVLPPVILPSNSGNALRLETRGIGMQLSFGFVVVGSCRPDFPTEEEKLLLSVAANQAATALQAALLSAERAAVSKELVQSEERFRAIVETTPECVKLVARDGTLLHMNSAGLEMIGADCADLVVGKNIYDVIAAEDRERFREFNEKICRGERGSLEFDIVGMNGVRRHMETHAAPFRSHDGSIVQLAVARDVSARKHAEKALREREQRFRSLSACSPVGFFLTDTSGNCVYTNARCQEICGFTFEEALGHGWAEFVHPADRGRVLTEWAQTAMHGGEFAAEFRWGRSGEDIRWSFIRSAPQISDDGQVIGHVGTVEDITARKQAEEARHKLAAIVESSDDAIVSKNLSAIVTSWNPSAERMFGYTAEEMIGRSILTIIPPEMHSDEDMILSKIRRGEKINHFETVRVTKSGERIEVSLSISPVRDDQGKIIGAAKIARNITENKKIERALRTTEKLAAAGRLAATVAHEINNPLEAVTNLVFLAKRDLPDAAKVARHLDMAERELDRVAHIARQTLGFYRETSSPTSVNVVKTLDDLLYLYEKRLETRSIQVRKVYTKAVEITGLAGEIRQAFSNLISNAIDAMPHGGSLVIKVSESHRWGGSPAEGVRVSVLDTGSGIGRQEQKHLFEPFFTTKADVGTGLGLWITRNIIEKHGGTIRFKSKGGAGTVFSVFLPLSGKSAGTGPRDISQQQPAMA